jgi:AraC family transcriptional regulator
MRRGLSGDNFVRLVGGRIKSSVVTEAPGVRIESIHRVADGPWHWHFRQPEVCLFWCKSVPEGLNATIDGRQTTCDYPGRLSGLVELSREAERPDNVFGLLVEGWSMQAMARIARVVRGEVQNPRRTGGLSARNARIVANYIETYLGKEITLHKLAELSGLSKRHFQRAFQETFRVTLYRYVTNQRIAQAKPQLARAELSITDVALTNGFCQAEHFSNVFKRITGFTPSQYRERHR